MSGLFSDKKSAPASGSAASDEFVLPKRAGAGGSAGKGGAGNGFSPVIASRSPAGLSGRDNGQGTEDMASAEAKTLVVGSSIRLKGEIGQCDRVLIHGTAEASLVDCRAFEIFEGGLLNGSAEVETAEIRGRFEGTLTVRGRLTIRSTGRVSGRISYAEVEIEPGGRLDGEIASIEPQLVAASQGAM